MTLFNRHIGFIMGGIENIIPSHSECWSGFFGSLESSIPSSER